MKKLLVAAMSFVFVAMLVSTAAAQGASTDSPGANSPGVAASGLGVLKKASFRSEPGLITTSSTSFVTVIADTVTLTASGCILAQYHGEIAIAPADPGSVNKSSAWRIVIGGVVGEGHNAGGIVFKSPDGQAGGSGFFETEGYNSWRCGLGVGSYSVLVQVAQAALAGDTVFVRGRSLVTQWKK